jgi:hypothetical protein
MDGLVARNAFAWLAEVRLCRGSFSGRLTVAFNPTRRVRRASQLMIVKRTPRVHMHQPSWRRTVPHGLRGRRSQRPAIGEVVAGR